MNDCEERIAILQDEITRLGKRLEGVEGLIQIVMARKPDRPELPKIIVPNANDSDMILKGHRPSMATAGVNFAGAMARSAGLGRGARDETVAERRSHCMKPCPIMVTHGPRHYCGERWADVKLQQLTGSVPDEPGCGCNVEKKIRDPNASCPLDPPKWGPEPQPASENASPAGA